MTGTSSAPLRVRKAAVLGAGVMGAQIAAHLVNADVETILFDLAAKDGDKNGIVTKAIQNLGKLSPTPLGEKGRAAAIVAANYDENLEWLKGCDLVTHEPRKLSRDLLDKTTLPVAMGFNHQDFLRETFNREVRLFNEVCFQKREPILDLHEALPNWQSDLKASRAYVLSVIDYIFTAMPAFVIALHALERRGHTLPD